MGWINKTVMLLMIWQQTAWPSTMLEAFMVAVREGVEAGKIGE